MNNHAHQGHMKSILQSNIQKFCEHNKTPGHLGGGGGRNAQFLADSFIFNCIINHNILMQINICVWYQVSQHCVFVRMTLFKQAAAIRSHC